MTSYYEYEEFVDDYHHVSHDIKSNSFRLKLHYIKSTNGIKRYGLDLYVIDSLSHFISKNEKKIQDLYIDLKYINPMAFIIAFYFSHIIPSNKDIIHETLLFFKKYKLYNSQILMIIRYIHFLNKFKKS